MENIVARTLLSSLLFVVTAQAISDYKFFIVRSDEFQNPGRLVKYTLTMTLPESTPLKTKVKMPFNTTAILRISKIEVTSVDPKLQLSGSTAPTLTSSASDGINDIALIDFGNITRQSSENDTKIVIEFQAQVLLHSHIVHGGKQWVSVGSEYKNASVWAAQLAVKTVNPVSARPHLDANFSAIQHSYPVFGSTVEFKVEVFHSPKTSAEAESGVVEWTMPDYLTYVSSTRANGSILITKVNSAAHSVRFEFGKLGFAEKLEFTFVANLDPSKTKADGKTHHLSSYLNLSYNGPAGSACASSSRSREYAVDQPITSHFFFYAPRSDCDGALGMENGAIQDSQITVSSYNPNGLPSDARLKKQGCWIAAQRYWTEKNQFLQVNFTNKMKIRRIAVQGCGFHNQTNFYVRKLSVYHSDDGTMWRPYKEGFQTKVFTANTDNTGTRLIVFAVPIEGKFIRIQPTEVESQINLRVEFYGCQSSEVSKDTTLKYGSRGYLLNKKSNVMYACDVPMKRRKDASSCFFSADNGLSWKAIDYRLMYILGYDSETKHLYGVATNLQTVMKSGVDHSHKFTMIAEKDWEPIHGKVTTIFPITLDANDMTVMNDTSSDSPLAQHKVKADSGSEWGVSPLGIHFYDSSVWKLRMRWTIESY